MRFFSLLIFFLFLVSAVGVQAQSAENDGMFPNDVDRVRTRPSTSIREMIEKQRAAKRKKEHEEMLKRGEEALELVDQLNSSLETAGGFTNDDREKLDRLEKIASRIRKDLGGGSDGTDRFDAEEKPPADVRQGFNALKESTEKLVKELNRTTRYTISAAAIQTSNAVIKFARFLRIAP
ncbi:MAG: hypothetical protein KF762_15825 [Acidobacteria bacterium]|nr:hypothetical protein [Acidobacteriota bacterium]